MTPSASKSQTIILIPAYQPASSLLATTAQLVAAGYTVVVVDDGSQKDYQHIFSDLNEHVHVVKHLINKGKGAALKTGYRYIREHFADYVIITADADGQHRVDDIIKLANTYAAQPATLLLGVRTFDDASVPLRSKFGNVLTRKIFSLITKQPLRDTQTGLRAFDASLTDFMLGVPGERFEYEMNVLLACSRDSVPIAELPIHTIYEADNPSSHFNPIKDSWAIYKEVIKFASSSLASFAIDYGVFIVLVHLTSSWALAGSVTFANIGARLVSASFNFTVNRRLIFKHTGSIAKGTAQYALLAAGILIGNTVLLNLLTGGLDIAPYLAKLMAEIAFFCISYLVQKHVIFAKKGAETI